MLTAEQYRKSVTNDPNIQQNPELFFLPLFLFNQAFLCHQARTFAATAMMCRATLESALITFHVIYRDEEKGLWAFDFPQDLAGGLRRIYIDELVRAIK